MSTRYVAQIIVSRVESSKTLSGFAGTGPAKEHVETDMSVVISEGSLSGLMTKINYSLSLAYPTVKASDTKEEAPDGEV